MSEGLFTKSKEPTRDPLVSLSSLSRSPIACGAARQSGATLQEETIGELVVRPVTELDAPIVSSILEECGDWLANRGLSHWHKKHSIGWARRVLRNGLSGLIAESYSDPFGVLLFRFSDHFKEIKSRTKSRPHLSLGDRERFAWIAKVGVLPSSHRCGIGSALLESCEHFCIQSGVSRVYLDVACGDHSAQQFYERFGYQRVGKLRACYLYERFLDSA